MLRSSRLLLLAAAVSLAACSTDPDESPNNANSDINGKSDTPKVRLEEACTLRNDDVLNTGKPRFLRDFVRWPAGDVEGVNTVNEDSRGQEYTEYFAIVMSPDPAGSALQEAGAVYGIPRDFPVGVELNEDQLFWLEDNANTQVGSCVFTSWHGDIVSDLPCAAAGTCPTVHGVAMTPEVFRMRIGFNTNVAASDLVQKCFDRASQASYGGENSYENEFFRGCMLVADLYGTEWRSSDPQICAASMRLAECGCFATADPTANLAFALIPTIEQQQEAWGGIGFRGFPLGTWESADALPLGCQYVSTGPEANGVDGRNFVACAITANDLLQNRDDPKEFCRQKYGGDVVVHVPVPADAITCNPPAEGGFAHTCEADPWIVRQTVNAAQPAQCCRVCTTGKACGDTCIAQTLTCSVDSGCACDG